ncbi:MAG: FAD-dependent oxidoreductase [Candidatus Spechtbacterales bacterium]|nr:FAD-dependent oxidoreductase [Candidatus Spechtbacterales bacterium]
MELILALKKEEADDAVTFYFEYEDPLSWEAGQFLHYILPHTDEDSRGNDRYFTIASAPYEDEIMLTTRKGESSFKKALFNMQEGDIIYVEEPAGSFVKEDKKKKAIFIAGGIGITPFRSILKQLDHDGAPIDVTLLYANSTDNFVYEEELKRLEKKHDKLNIHWFVSPEKIDKEAIKKYVSEVDSVPFYVSGPEPMVEHYEKILPTIGVSEENIKKDYFPGYPWE